MSSFPQVLIVSRDPLLLQTRLWILEPYFAVSGVGDIADAVPLIEKISFDLIILCHTIPNEECLRFVKLIESHKPEARMLVLSAGPLHCLPPEIEHYSTLDAGPGSLLRSSAEILGIEVKRQRLLYGSSPVPTSE